MTYRPSAAPILGSMPRRLLQALCPLAAIALVAPAAAGAGEATRHDRAQTAAPSAAAAQPAPANQPVAADGMLTLRACNGLLVLSGRGSVLGQVMGKARVLIDDPDPSDGVPVVSGYDRVQKQGRTAVLYIGTDMRFRVLSGAFKLRVSSTALSLSFVGKGLASLAPAGTQDDGAYSLDGGETYRAIGFGTTTNLVVGATSAVQTQGMAVGVPLETK